MADFDENEYISENIVWGRKARIQPEYATVAYEDGGEYYAERRTGDLIASGSDASAIIQAAIDEAADDMTDSTKQHRRVSVYGRFEIPSTLLLKSWIELDLQNAVLTLADGANADMFQLASSDTEQVKVVGGELRGNKANNTAGSAFSIANNGTGYSFNDPYHQIRNVYIMNFPNQGVEFTDWSLETRLVNVMVEAVNGASFDCGASPDIKVVNCVSGFSGLEGFISGDETIFNGCAAWYAGQQDETRGDGFLLSGNEGIVTGCRSEDNWRHGFNATAWRQSITGCRSMNNGQGSVTGNGIDISGDETTVTGCHAYDDQGTSTQENGIAYRGSLYNVIVGNYATGNVNQNIYGWGDSLVKFNYGASAASGTASDYSMNWSNETIVVYSSGAARTVTLPDPTVAVDVPLTVKAPNATTNSVTITQNGTESIDGSTADITLSTDNAFRTFVSDGSDWWVVGSN